MNNVNEFCERFKELRLACQMTQDEFGEVLGVKRTAIYLIESGRRKLSEKQIYRLEKWPKYRINMEWLIDGKGTSKFLEDPNAMKMLELKEAFGLNDAQYNLFKNFLELPKNSRDVVSDYLESCFGDRVPKEKNVDLPSSTKELETLEKQYTPKEEENA